MKIEKISNSQIKCFLNKGDLLSREIKVSELAYGTDKAQELFKDMMEQANHELGFEVNNVPLMIEAVPLSTDSIMLIITKVDNPSDMESKFSSLPNPDSRKFTKKQLNATTNNSDESSLLPSLDNTTKLTVFFLYAFSSLDNISFIAHKLVKYPINSSTIYKNNFSGKYYLAMTSSHIDRMTCKVIRGLLSEYGEQITTKKSILNYYDEHYEMIIKENALNVIVNL